MSLKILAKKLRNIYYRFYDGSIAKIRKPEVIKEARWLINKESGRAYFKGYYEPELTSFLIKNLSDNSNFFDIGAHVGYFSLIASKICTNGHIVSFEPFPSNVKLIETVRNLNFVSNWSIVDKAVSDSNSEVNFEVGETSSMGKINNSSTSSLKIPTLTLDDYIQSSGIKPNIVKIDVEGHGDRVLKGFELIKSISEIKILIEIHENSHELSYIKEVFKSGFKAYDLNNMPIDLRNNKVPNHIVLVKE